MTKTPYLALYYNWAHIMNDFTDAECGRLIKAVIAYSEGKTEEPKLSRVLTVAYKFIIDTIDRTDARAESVASRQKKTKKPSKKTVRGVRGKINVENREESSCEDEPLEEKIEEIPASSTFTPPALCDVRELFARRGFKSDPEEFYNFYESKGWLVGQSPMRNWEASAANWEIKVVRERIDSKKPTAQNAGRSPEAEKPRAGNFDVHEAFKKAIERSYGGYYDDDDEEDNIEK